MQSVARVVRLTLHYEGTDYVGWQRQRVGRSVQGTVEAALMQIVGHPVAVRAASRTDAGVHAVGQSATAQLDHRIATGTLARALNAVLPTDIRVAAVKDVNTGFDARARVRAKTYRYLVTTGEIVSPLFRHYVWHVGRPLDCLGMATAARLLEGCHDFSAFRSVGGSAKTSVRTIFRLAVDERPVASLGADLDSEWRRPAPGALIVFHVCGDGFLRHMVRAIVGTLVDVGMGRRSPGSLEETLASRARERAGPTAPARGLCLVSVEYERPGGVDGDDAGDA